MERITIDCPLCFDEDVHEISIHETKATIHLSANITVEIPNVSGSSCTNKLREIENSNIITDGFLTGNVHLAIAIVGKNQYRFFFTNKRTQKTRLSHCYGLDALSEIIDRIKNGLITYYSILVQKNNPIKKRLVTQGNAKASQELAGKVNKKVMEATKTFYHAINKQRKGAIE